MGIQVKVHERVSHLAQGSRRAGRPSGERQLPSASQTSESVPDVGMSLALGSTQRTANRELRHWRRCRPNPLDKALPGIGRWRRSKRASARAQAAGGGALRRYGWEKASPARIGSATAKVPGLGAMASPSCSMSPALGHKGEKRRRRTGGCDPQGWGCRPQGLTLSARVLSLV